MSDAEEAAGDKVVVLGASGITGTATLARLVAGAVANARRLWAFAVLFHVKHLRRASLGL